MTNIRKDLFADVNTVGSRYITVGHLNIEQKQSDWKLFVKSKTVCHI